MRIKYGEIPRRETLQKLLSVSFDTPRKNLAVYKFCKAMTAYVDYVENERTKLVQKHGVQDKNNPLMYFVPQGTEEMKRFQEEFNSVLNMEIEEEVKLLPLSEMDFVDNCSYSQEKADWLNPREIGSILTFCK